MDILLIDLLRINQTQLRTFSSSLILTKKIFTSLHCFPTGEKYIYNGAEIGKTDFAYSLNSDGKVQIVPTRTSHSDFYLDSDGKPTQTVTSVKVELIEALSPIEFNIVEWGKEKSKAREAIMFALTDTFPSLEPHMINILDWYPKEWLNFETRGFLTIIDALNNEDDSVRLETLNIKPYASMAGHPLQPATIRNLVLARLIDYYLFLGNI